MILKTNVSRSKGNFADRRKGLWLSMVKYRPANPPHGSLGMSPDYFALAVPSGRLVLFFMFRLDMFFSAVEWSFVDNVSFIRKHVPKHQLGQYLILDVSPAWLAS